MGRFSSLLGCLAIRNSRFVDKYPDFFSGLRLLTDSDDLSVTVQKAYFELDIFDGGRGFGTRPSAQGSTGPLR
jgi:hypothetical protein